MKLHRRAFLASTAAASLLAGCLDDGGGDESGARATDAEGTTVESSGDSSVSTTAMNSTATVTTVTNRSSASADETTTQESTASVAATLDHPAATALAGQPFLGPAPGTAPTLVIAFEDPSCHNCRRFNQNAFPTLESKLVETGKTTYVYRNFPYAFAWGKPAIQALEATFARSESAFWQLSHHYFDAQGEFGGSNVLDRTREFLDTQTDLDADAVVEDARNKAHDEAVERDVSAGEAAGVVSTPTFYLFREGSFRTEIRGAQSYEVFAEALGVR